MLRSAIGRPVLPAIIRVLSLVCLFAVTACGGDVKTLSDEDVTTAKTAQPVVEARRLLQAGTQPERAASLLMQAAREGNPIAQLGLADLYARGIGTAADDVKSTALLRQAAEAGLGEAQIALGRAYLLGQGAPPDRARSDYWLQRAADQDSPRIWVDLGQFYRARHDSIAWSSDSAASRSDQMNPDYRVAFLQFMRAANKGDADGQYFVCANYVDGYGVSKSRYVGLKWCDKAAAQSHAEALQLANALRSDGVLDHVPTVSRRGCDANDIIAAILYSALFGPEVGGDMLHELATPGTRKQWCRDEHLPAG